MSLDFCPCIIRRKLDFVDAYPPKCQYDMWISRPGKHQETMYLLARYKLIYTQEGSNSKIQQLICKILKRGLCSIFEEQNNK